MNWIKNLIAGKAIQWILARLKEPSTWKAIFGLAGIGGIWVRPEMLEQIASLAGGAILFVELIKKEKDGTAQVAEPTDGQ